MKLIYHHRTQAEDGQAVHIRSMIQALEEQGHGVREVALVSRSEAPKAQKVLHQGDPPGGLRSLLRLPNFAREIAEHLYSFPAKGRLVRAGREFQPDAIYERYAFGNRAGLWAAKSLGVPLLLEVNSPMVLELSRTRGLRFPRWGQRVERELFCGADRVLVVTKVLGQTLVELGVDPDRLVVTPNGVHLDLYDNPDREAARRDLGLQSVSGPVLGFVGWVREWHRLDLVIDALAQGGLKDAHLVIIGGGPALEGLAARATDSGVSERVHLVGPRLHRSIPGLLAAFDLGLVPAINSYASPLKLHEYMAAGLPVIAPDQPNLREVLRHEREALLFPPGDGAAFLTACQRLVDESQLRADLGAAARQSILDQDLTWKGNVRRVERALGELS
jgi:glycosyltransferase involved in cell wall biosynthesis